MSIRILKRPPAVTLPAALLLAALVPFALLSTSHPAQAQTSTARVATAGDCLHMRAAPADDAAVVLCLADGTTVEVVSGGHVADGRRWVAIVAEGRSGWAAAEFLDGLPGAEGSDEQQVLLAGSLPGPGGTGIAVSGGGDGPSLFSAAGARGCTVRSLWANGAGGAMIGFVAGAPAAVNAGWLAHFEGGFVPEGEPLLVVCEDRVAARSAPPEVEPVERFKVTLTYYYCRQGSVGIGDGGGYCGRAADGTPVAPGVAACARHLLGQRFRIVGDPNDLTYTCADIGSAVVAGHRDIWFATSDEGYGWWREMDGRGVIEVLPGE